MRRINTNNDIIDLVYRVDEQTFEKYCKFGISLDLHGENIEIVPLAGRWPYMAEIVEVWRDLCEEFKLRTYLDLPKSMFFAQHDGFLSARKRLGSRDQFWTNVWSIPTNSTGKTSGFRVSLDEMAMLAKEYGQDSDPESLEYWANRPYCIHWNTDARPEWTLTKRVSFGTAREIRSFAGKDVIGRWPHVNPYSPATEWEWAPEDGYDPIPMPDNDTAEDWFVDPDCVPVNGPTRRSVSDLLDDIL